MASLNIGKYRNVDIATITDIKYLKWAMENMEDRRLPVTALFKRILEFEPEYVSKRRGTYQNWIAK